MGLEWEHRPALPDSKSPSSEPWEQRGSCMPGPAGSRDCCLYNTAAKNVSQCKRGRNCSLRMMQKALTKDGLMLLSPKEKQNRILPTRAIEIIGNKTDSACLVVAEAFVTAVRASYRRDRQRLTLCCPHFLGRRQFPEPGERSAAEWRRKEGLACLPFPNGWSASSSQLHREWM